MDNKVYVYSTSDYGKDLRNYINISLFNVIKPNDCVVIKPNWVKESHLMKPNEWDYIVTHPSLITCVLDIVLEKLQAGAKIIIADSPQTDSSFEKIIAHYPVVEWQEMAKRKEVNLQIIDLREDEVIDEGEVVISRKKLPGDPRGSTEVNLKETLSEFYNHTKSKRGYYGADYDIKETNTVHDGHKNLYRVSRSIIEADVFINLPKLKTHKKAGITCCLKNLVGINTYKNFLPHYSEGGPIELGDQFPDNKLNARIEGPIMAYLKQNILLNTSSAKMFKPIKRIGKVFFGDTNQIIRSGNWYGNDTIWRMILDLNKILLYANPDGSLREDNWIKSKKYIGIVDAVLAGEGNGPMAPDPVAMNSIICGSNPVAIDAVCATLMGFSPYKIPAIYNSFNIKKYRICKFNYEEIIIEINNNIIPITQLEPIKKFVPHFGWQSKIES